MNYQEFIDLWVWALRQTRFLNYHPSLADETVDLRTMDRTYKVLLHWLEKDEPKLFHVCAEISWNWNALFTARFATTEEDMLMQLYGDFGIHEDTEPPWLRIDITLFINFAYDSKVPVPLLASWQKWLAEVNKTVNPVLPEEVIWDSRNPSSFRYQSEPKAEISFGPNGETYLQCVSLEAWQGVSLPRQWDDPDKVDPDPAVQLVKLAERIQNALVLWRESLDLLIKDKT